MGRGRVLEGEGFGKGRESEGVWSGEGAVYREGVGCGKGKGVRRGMLWVGCWLGGGGLGWGWGWVCEREFQWELAKK